MRTNSPVRSLRDACPCGTSELARFLGPGIFELAPVRANVDWHDVESRLNAVAAVLNQGRHSPGYGCAIAETILETV
jgi:hypothetical protein